MMADLQSDAEKPTVNLDDDFMDPLGAKDPLTMALEEETDELEFEVR